MAAIFSTVIRLAKRCLKKWSSPIPLPTIAPPIVTKKMAAEIRAQELRDYHKRFVGLDSKGVRVPANIRRRFLGSKIFKIDRDD